MREKKNAVSDWTSSCGLISVLPVLVLQSCQDYEGRADAALHLPGQRVPPRAAEPLADPFPHRSGFSVFLSDTEQAAPGEAVGLRSVTTTPGKERILGFLSRTQPCFLSSFSTAP